jgi:FAD/FMN-containing dehydrogenase
MNKIIEINTTYDYAIVEGATTWFELIKELDKYDYTILSCQSGLTFSIGGSFCGNAHGKKTKINTTVWQVINLIVLFNLRNSLIKKLNIYQKEKESVFHPH